MRALFCCPTYLLVLQMGYHLFISDRSSDHLYSEGFNHHSRLCWSSPPSWWYLVRHSHDQSSSSRSRYSFFFICLILVEDSLAINKIKPNGIIQQSKWISDRLIQPSYLSIGSISAGDAQSCDEVTNMLQTRGIDYVFIQPEVSYPILDNRINNFLQNIHSLVRGKSLFMGDIDNEQAKSFKCYCSFPSLCLQTCWRSPSPFWLVFTAITLHFSLLLISSMLQGERSGNIKPVEYLSRIFISIYFG